MRRLAAILILAATSFLAAPAAGLAAPRNALLIVVDDLGWKDLGCYGSTYYQTPHIDRLAAEGVRFTNAYAASAICTPTRASILTGKTPARLLLTQWLPAGRWDAKKNRMKEGRYLQGLPREEITLAEALREKGCATASIGKWHLGDPPFSLPEHHGFDLNVAGESHGAPGSYFYPFEGEWLIPTTGIKVKKQTLTGEGKPGDCLTDLLTDHAIRFMEKSAGASRPFFLYLPYYAVHSPLEGKPDKVKKYEAIPKAERQGNPKYAAMIETVDDNVGRLLETLTKLHLTENTLVILTSDNGGLASATDHAPLRANKGSFYEGGIRIPLIIRAPGCLAGHTSAEPVITTDLAPTVLDALGHPPLPHQHLDGLSLVPLLEKQDATLTEQRDTLYWHYPHYNQHPQSFPCGVIREKNWKLIEHFETGQLELFDLKNDPGETNDLSSENKPLTQRLLEKLKQWQKEVGADPMRENLEWRGTVQIPTAP